MEAPPAPRPRRSWALPSALALGLAIGAGAVLLLRGAGPQGDARPRRFGIVLPVGVRFTDEGPGREPGTRRGRLTAAPTVRHGTHSVLVQAASPGGATGNVFLELRVLFLPPGFQGIKEGQDEKKWAIEDENLTRYYRRIVRPVPPDNQPVEFMLIPRSEPR